MREIVPVQHGHLLETICHSGVVLDVIRIGGEESLGENDGIVDPFGDALSRCGGHFSVLGQQVAQGQHGSPAGLGVIADI